MTHEPRIYFVRSARSNAIKIGVSADVPQRLRSLQNTSAERLLVVAEIPGDERYEKVLHEHFAEYRIRGEWFRCVGRLAAFVAMLPSLPSSVRPRTKHRSKPAFNRVPIARRADFRAFWAEHLRLISKAVHCYGVDRFAVLVGVPSWRVSAALRGNSRHCLSEEWIQKLMRVTSRDHRLAILSHQYTPSADPAGAVDVGERGTRWGPEPPS